VSLLEDLKQRKDENYEKTLKELNPLLKQFDRVTYILPSYTLIVLFGISVDNVLL